MGCAADGKCDAMKGHDKAKELISPALLEQIEAVAAAEHRSAPDMLREMIEGYLSSRHAVAASGVGQPPERRTPREAAARILERRKFHPLPDGATIRDMLTHGRA
ncbi:MAG: hypothetical protein P4L76_02790 [Beijerinckiaceae bacterium]|nr:hypothetical protein [Beijerinckiaceae bacterium]